MIKLIVCIDLDGNIGYKNKLLFNIKDDMAFFKKQTTGHIVLMGYNTYESLGCKGLPNRFNLVLTSRELEPAKNVCAVKSLNGTIEEYKDNNIRKDLFIIGGASVYNQAIADRLPDEILLTVVDAHAEEADTAIDMKSLRKRYKKVEEIDIISDDDYAATIEKWTRRN